MSDNQRVRAIRVGLISHWSPADATLSLTTPYTLSFFNGSRANRNLKGAECIGKVKLIIISGTRKLSKKRQPWSTLAGKLELLRQRRCSSTLDLPLTIFWDHALWPSLKPRIWLIYFCHPYICLSPSHRIIITIFVLPSSPALLPPGLWNGWPVMASHWPRPPQAPTDAHNSNIHQLIFDDRSKNSFVRNNQTVQLGSLEWAALCSTGLLQLCPATVLKAGFMTFAKISESFEHF